MKYTAASVAAVALLSGLAGTASASPWSQANGSGSFFTWSNGQDQTDLFGSPVLVGGSRFQFFPTSFYANATNGQTASATDQFDVDLDANSGYRFTEIRIDILGTYTIQGTGSVSAGGTLSILDAANSRSTSDPLLTNPVFPVFSGTNANWTGVADRDLTLIEGGTPFTHIHISYSHSMIAICEGSSSSFIETTLVGFPVAVTIIPEPSALALLGLGGLVALRRRR